MGEIRALPGHTLEAPAATNKEIIGSLEGLLERARSGQIRAIAWCVYTEVDQVGVGWNCGAYGHHLTSAIFSLCHKYGNAMEAESVTKDPAA